MSRHDETIGRMPNPSQFFLEWNTTENTLCYYSKEETKNTPFPLPFRFLALKFMNSITGYNKGLKQGIYSNEVQDTRLEHFRVNLRDGSILASGLYADIKDEVNKAGGKFTRSIYAITPKGVIVNIQLKGSQTQSFSSIEKFGNRWRDEWIQVSSFEKKIYKTDEKDVEYTVPVFSFGGSLTPDDEAKATKAYSLIRDYFNSKPAQSTGPHNARPSQPVSAMPVTHSAPALPSADESDDLPF